MCESSLRLLLFGKDMGGDTAVGYEQGMGDEPAPRRLSDTSTEESASPDPTVIEKWMADCQMKTLGSQHQQRLLEHFVTFMSGILKPPLDRGGEAVLLAIMQISSKDPMVLTAVLCVGASYLVNQLPSGSTELQPLEDEKQRLLQGVETQQCVRRSTALHQNQDRETLFLSYLLLYFYEICEGTGDSSWQLRLNEARDILFDAVEAKNILTSESRQNHFPSTTVYLVEILEDVGIQKPLVRLFIYHDILGSVTNPKPSPRSVQILKGHAHATRARPFMHEEGHISMIARISTLQSDIQPGSVPSGAAISEALCIWKELDSWRDINHGQLTELSPSEDSLYEAYIAASFIWLFLVLHPENIADEKVQTMVRGGLQSLRARATTELSELRSFAMFPVFVIGVACVRVQDREELEGYMGWLEGTRPVGNIRVCWRVIKSAWRAYDNGNRRSWDWKRLMEVEDVSVPLA